MRPFINRDLWPSSPWIPEGGNSYTGYRLTTFWVYLRVSTEPSTMLHFYLRCWFYMAWRATAAFTNITIFSPSSLNLMRESWRTYSTCRALGLICSRKDIVELLLPSVVPKKVSCPSQPAQPRALQGLFFVNFGPATEYFIKISGRLRRQLYPEIVLSRSSRYENIFW